MRRCTLAALILPLVASQLGCLGCSSNDASPPANAVEHRDALVPQPYFFGNPADLATNDAPVAGDAITGTSIAVVCAPDLYWAYYFRVPMSGTPSNATIFLQAFNSSAGGDTFSARACPVVSGQPNCSQFVSAGAGVLTTNQGATWLSFNLVAAGTNTLAAGSEAALVIHAIRTPTNTCVLGDHHTITLPDIGVDIPLGPDGLSDNQLWLDGGSAFVQDTSHEPLFAVGWMLSDGGELGVGTPFAAGEKSDGFDGAVRAQSFVLAKKSQIFSVGVALDETSPTADAQANLLSSTGAAIFADGGPGTFTFSASTDGGDFYWASFSQPIILPAGTYELSFPQQGTANHRYAWRRDTPDEGKNLNGDTTPDSASFQGSTARALQSGGGGPAAGATGDDYVFLMDALSCTTDDGNAVAEICDGIDNDCDGVVDDNLSDVTFCAATGPCASIPETCPADGGAYFCDPGSLFDAGITDCSTTTTTSSTTTTTTTSSTTTSGSSTTSTTTAGTTATSTSGSSSTSSTTGSSSSSSSSSTTGSSSSSSSTTTTGSSSSSSSSSSTTGSSSASSSSSSSSSASSSSSTSGSSSSSSSTSTTGSSSSSGSSSSASSASTSSSTGSSSSSSTTGTETTGTIGSGSGSGSVGAGSTGGVAGAGGSTGGTPANFALSGCGCSSLMDPGFGAIALLLLVRRRRR